MRNYAVAMLGGLMMALLAAVCGKPSPSAPTASSSIPNRAPTVNLTTQGPSSCNPVGSAINPDGSATGCPVTLIAIAADADGDPLTYSWSGTTSFSQNTGYCRATSQGSNIGTCTIRSPEEIIVGSVTVRDDHGHEISDSIQVIGEGVNHPPSVRLSPPMPLPGASLLSAT